MLLLNSFIIIYAIILSACGVKGSPAPPIKPAFIGNGEPQFIKNSKSPNLNGENTTPAGGK